MVEDELVQVLLPLPSLPSLQAPLPLPLPAGAHARPLAPSPLALVRVQTMTELMALRRRSSMMHGGSSGHANTTSGRILGGSFSALPGLGAIGGAIGGLAAGLPGVTGGGTNTLASSTATALRSALELERKAGGGHGGGPPHKGSSNGSGDGSNGGKHRGKQLLSVSVCFQGEVVEQTIDGELQSLHASDFLSQVRRAACFGARGLDQQTRTLSLSMLRPADPRTLSLDASDVHVSATSRVLTRLRPAPEQPAALLRLMRERLAHDKRLVTRLEQRDKQRHFEMRNFPRTPSTPHAHALELEPSAAARELARVCFLTRVTPRLGRQSPRAPMCSASASCPSRRRASWRRSGCRRRCQ